MLTGGINKEEMLTGGKNKMKRKKKYHSRVNRYLEENQKLIRDYDTL